MADKQGVRMMASRQEHGIVGATCAKAAADFDCREGCKTDLAAGKERQ
jgi:hypothetical protein